MLLKWLLNDKFPTSPQMATLATKFARLRAFKHNRNAILTATLPLWKGFTYFFRNVLEVFAKQFDKRPFYTTLAY